MDFRLDKRDGQYKLLDFNPRLGMNFRMFEDSGGVDVVRAMHLDLTGRKVARLPQAEGRTFVAEPYDFLASFGYMRRGGLTAQQWWRTFKGRKEYAWFSLTDPIPFAVMWIRLTLSALRSAMLRLRTRLRGRS